MPKKPTSSRPASSSRPQKPSRFAGAPGLLARHLAAEAIGAVTEDWRALDESLDQVLERAEASEFEERDRGLVRAIAMAGIRHFGTIRKALLARLKSGMPSPSGSLAPVLVGGAAQILYLDVPDHAAVDLSIRLLQIDGRTQRYTGLANAVLRRIAREKEQILAAADPLADDTPDWLRERWVGHYGEAEARAIAAAHGTEPGLDLTVKADPERWAVDLDALLLPTGSLRLRQRAPLPSLPGYTDGAWWVQDAAAALPARLLAPRPGERIADLCAAPGGKTAQLAAAGAQVLAVDRAPSRMRRLTQNMARLHLQVETRVADALTLEDTGFDAVLVDAPCSATGTIRRHPDVAWTKTPDDVERLAALQRRLLGRAAAMVRPGGRIVYCTCSLEPEEGERQMAAFLDREAGFARLPVTAAELPGLTEAITPEGDVRTRPSMLASDEPRLAGLDGFFIGRLVRQA
ncbi:MAG: RsmB/NOP family class I SAM-dependent RNA methyltransferase [Alsobacter sp.]